MDDKVLQMKRNPAQSAFLNAVLFNQADFEKVGQGKYQTGFRATFQGGRASGKTYVLIDTIAHSAFALPRAVAGVGSRTFKQVQDIILSQSQGIFEQHGLYEYDSKSCTWGHYVINKRPPSHFRKAFNAPKSYDNTMSFINGYTVIMISADRPETQRGLNLDQYFGDETAFTKEDFFLTIIRPAVRANKYAYHDARPQRRGYNNPLHWLIADFTSAPHSPEGLWVYKTEERMKKDARRYYFLQSTAYDNIEFLPGNYIEQQQEELGEYRFMVEIMNKRPEKLTNAFYSAFGYEKHTYTGYGYEWDDEKRQYNSTSNDYDTLKPLEVSFDFNARFTSMVVAQDFGKEFKFINNLWVKESHSTLVEKLCDNFIDSYKHHLKKRLFLYGDHSGNKKDAGRNKTFFETIKGRLTTAGWEVHDMVQSSYPPYLVRYKVINALLSEQNNRLPRIRINQDKCKSLILSLQNSPIIKETFEKDKSLESKEHFAQENATHLSDCFDYILFKKYSKFIDVPRSSGFAFRNL